MDNDEQRKAEIMQAILDGTTGPLLWESYLSDMVALEDAIREVGRGMYAALQALHDDVNKPQE